jgi:RND family efflux transporter MFP subunit
MGGRQFSGRATAKIGVDLSFQVSGPLVSLPVDVGTQVKAGDVLAALDPRDFRAALDSAQGNLARSQANLVAMERGARPEEIEQLRARVVQAEATYRQAVAEHDRNARLLPDGAVSQSDYDASLARRDRSEAAVTQAQEELNIGLRGAREEDLQAKRAEIQALEAAVLHARNQLDFATLTAPFAGTVAARYVDNFQTVQAKQPIARLLDISKIEVTVQVPESLISLVPLVQQVLCRFDAIADREFPGAVTKIGTEASQTTRTFPVTVQLDQPEDVQILPGMAASLRVDTSVLPNQAPSDIVVPPSAVFAGEAGQQSHVWILQPEGTDTFRAALRSVTTGRLTPTGVAITDGLQTGEWVVTAGVNALQADQVVRILEEGSR